MYTYKKILTIQDISCVGQCSLTVALPILSACGLETCILPSAVLSTHTAGFSGYTFRDLTEDMGPIIDHWKKEGIRFEGVYTGYLGSAEQIALVKRIMDELLTDGAVKIVDPAMADNGKLYPAFDGAFVEEMKKLVGAADIVVPNITEACFLTGMDYREKYDEAYILELCEKLTALGAKKAVITGVSYRDDKLGIAVFESGKMRYYEHEKMAKGCHGTGDVYASAFAGAILRGRNLFEAAKIAGDYTLACIRYTGGDPEHWYGVKFEPVLPELIRSL